MTGKTHPTSAGSFWNHLSDWLLYSNLLIGLCAVAFFQTGCLMVGAYLCNDPVVLIFVFAATFSLYMVLRIYSVHQLQERVMSYRLRWVRKNIKTCYWMMGVGGLATVVSFLLLPLVLKLVLLPAGFLAMAYGLPFMPFSKKFRLRQFKYVKVFLIAAVWAWIGSVFAETYAYAATANEFGGVVIGHWFAGLRFMLVDVTPLFLSRFCFILAITIPFDIRDIHTDRSYGLATLPTLLGAKKSVWLSQMFLLLSLVFWLYYHSWFEPLSTYDFIAAAVIGLTVGGIIAASKRIRSEFLYLGLLDATMIFELMVIIALLYPEV